MSLIPQVRMDAGLPPLVTPTSQIIGAQAVSCALDQLKGRPMYSNPSNQFVALVKVEYGKTPVPIDPEFRLKITGSRDEVPYDPSDYEMQENPVIEEVGVQLAENEKEVFMYLRAFPRLFVRRKAFLFYICLPEISWSRNGKEVQDNSVFVFYCKYGFCGK